jgi:hypothetical protein
MSAARIDNLNLMAPPYTQLIQRRSLTIGILFGIGALVLAFVETDKFFHAYLLAYMAWLGVTLGSMAFLMIYHLTGGGWGTVIRRPLEAATRTIPLMAILFIPILAGMKHIYFWTHPEAIASNKHLVELSHGYLSTSSVIFRAIAYFVIWIGLAWLLTRLSATQDKPPVTNLSPRFRVISGPGLVIYAFTITFAVIDWVMSLSAPWISTIYGFIFIVGQCLSAICFMVIVDRLLIRHEPMSKMLRPADVQDHGKLMLTFLMLWAYFSYSQFLIIWAGNLPGEITWYTRRLYHGWHWVGLAVVVLHFAVPFLLLLSRPFKRSAYTLVWLAAWLMLMRYLDLFWYIEANFSATFFVSISDVILPIAIGGLWLALFFRNLRQRPLLPPYALHVREMVGATSHD